METKVNTHIEEARAKIRQAIRQNGPYSHNIISLTLSFLADKAGVDAANGLVDEFRLDKIYGIHKSKEGPAQVIAQTVKKPEPPRKTREQIEKEEREQARKELNNKFLALAAAVVKVDPNFLRLTTTKDYNKQDVLTLEVGSGKFKNVTVTVFTDQPYVGWHRSTKTYVRLKTSDWDVHFRKNWTFDTKDVAKKVVEKAKELLEQIEGRIEYRNKKADKHERAQQYLKKVYGVKDSYEKHERTSAGLTLNKEEYSAVRFEFDVDSKTYHIEGLPTLTEKQFQNIVQIVKDK